MAWDGHVSARNRSRPRDWQQRRAAVLARDHAVCHLCGQPGADQVDHLLAVSHGGTHEMHNLASAHKTCTMSKNATEAARARHRYRERREPEPHPGIRPAD